MSGYLGPQQREHAGFLTVLDARGMYAVADLHGELDPGRDRGAAEPSASTAPFGDEQPIPADDTVDCDAYERLARDDRPGRRWTVRHARQRPAVAEQHARLVDFALRPVDERAVRGRGE